MAEEFVRRGHVVQHLVAGQRALLQPAGSDLIHIGSRRWFLQAGLAGIAGLSLPDMLRCRAQAAPQNRSRRRAVILFWLSGGPSHLDTWDPKPEAPVEVRGPFAHDRHESSRRPLLRAPAAAGQHSRPAGRPPCGRLPRQQRSSLCGDAIGQFAGVEGFETLFRRTAGGALPVDGFDRRQLPRGE